MNAHLPASRRKWPGRLANLAVVVVVLALAAATFVLSYAGVHAIVVQAGVSARLARLYPGLFDAVFVIACVAAVMLRDARWWARTYVWLVIIVMVAVVGAADAVHAMSVALPHRETEGVVAAVPWVLVLLGFSLMLTMLRHSRAQHAAVAAAPDGRAARRAAKRAGHALPTAPAADQTLPAAPIDSAAGIARPPAPAYALLPAAAALPPLAPHLDLPAAPTEPAAPEQMAPVAEEQSLPDQPAVLDEAVPVAEAAQAQEETSVPQSAPTREEPTLQEPTAAQEEPALQGPAPVWEEPDFAEPTPTQADPAFREPAPTQEESVAGEPAPTRAEPAVLDAVTPEAALADYWDADDENKPGEENYPTAIPEIDQDAPPFATAPFATVPRLNRVRSTPIPPEDDED